MKWFYNLRVAAKLIVSFVFVALIAGIIGFVGISSLKSVHEKGIFLYEKNTVPLEIMGNISTNFQRQRANILEVIISTDAAFKEDQLKRISERDSAIEKLILDYEKNHMDENAKIFDEFIKTLNSYKPLRDKALALAEQKKNDEAIQFYRKEMEISRKNVQAAIEKISEMHVEEAKERSNQNTVTANSSVTLMTVLMIAGVVLAVLIGWLISKIISSPLKALTDASDMLAVGNINVNIKQKSTDEIGLLVSSFLKMTGNIKEQTSAAEKIAIGDTSVELKAKSEFDILTKSMIKVVDTVRGLVSESVALSKAAVEGKLSVRGNTEKFQGGYREIIAGVNTTLDAVVEPINESSVVLEKMASGDLTVRMLGDYKGDYAKIKNSINNLANSFNNALSEVCQAVQATASASTQISSSSEEMAAGAQEQSSQTAEVASAVEQMTKTIIETTKNSASASESAKNAGTIAKDGGKVVNETIEGMNRIADVVKNSAVIVQALGKSSNEIGEIVQVIDDIADQTNLLALNAAIEAARAGEQGRGFAVVADEVRKLAERTTKATKEIATMIRQIQKDTEGAVVSMNEGTAEVEKGKVLADKAGHALKQIISGAEEVVDISTRVAAASEEQSSAAEQISRNIESISSVTNQSATGVQQIARAAEDLNRMTVNLQELIAQFKLDERLHKTETNKTLDNYKSQMVVRSNGKLVNC